jgi:hypothetical protein
MALTIYWESEIILTGPGRAHRATRNAKISACCVFAPGVAMLSSSVLVPDGE